MKEFFLRAFFAGEELYIIDQQCIDGAHLSFEVVDCAVLQGFYHLRYESFRMHIQDLGLRVVLQHSVTDRMHEVCLAQTNPAIDEQRVIHLARVVADLHTGGTSELI